MSNDDLDDELLRLRKELLIGLKKKAAGKSIEEDKASSKEATADEELERLRLEALSAKRATKKVEKKRGRFRYERESEEEEEDDDEDFERLKQSVKSDDEDEEETVKTEPEETKTTNRVMDLYEYNNLHRTNYETYRSEYDKIMANESYEPTVVGEEAVDLRSIVRDKTIKKQPSIISGDVAASIDEYEYKPITCPIDISDEKRRLMYRHNRKRSLSQQGSDSQRTDLNNKEDDETLPDNKRLKSVVVVKVNYTNSSSWKESTATAFNRRKISNYNNHHQNHHHHNKRRRNHSNSSTSSR